MSAEQARLVFRRRLGAGELVDRFQYAFGRRDTAHRLAAAELVPDLAVVRRRLLEETDRGRGHVMDLRLRHHAPQLRERAMLEIDAPRILRREVRLDPQRRPDRLE